MARNWLWRKSSFDGASFYVDTQEIQGGRRLVTHEYPFSERHDVEDMGRKAGKIELTAYFVSDTADADSAALIARLARGGAGLLQIPMFGAMRMIAETWGPGWSRQVLNYVGMRICFVEEGSAFAPVPIGLGAAQLGQMGAAFGGVVGGAISTLLAEQPLIDYARADMLVETRGLIAQVEDVRASTPLPERLDADLRFALASVAEVAADPQSDPGEHVATALATLDDIVAGATDGGEAAIIALDEALDASVAARTASLAQWGVSEMVSIVPLAGAMAFAAQASRLRAIQDYRERKSAQAARSQIATAAALLIDVYAPLGVEATVAFDEMIGKAVRHLSAQIPNLAPVVVVQLNASLPSCVLAYRLYGDPQRAGELVDRNKVATPCIMPAKFEAASS